jgi:hypothetical protein
MSKFQKPGGITSSVVEFASAVKVPIKLVWFVMLVALMVVWPLVSADVRRSPVWGAVPPAASR